MRNYAKKFFSNVPIVTSGLIQHIVMADYTSGATIPARVGATGTNYNAAKQSDGSLRCNVNEYCTLNNTLYGKTIEIIATCAAITNISYFTLGGNGSPYQDFTLVRMSNLLQYYPPLTSCGTASWNVKHNTACFLASNANGAAVKIWQNKNILKNSTTSQTQGDNIYIGTRNIASNYIYIYEIRLYNRELTDYELTQNYQSDKIKYGL